MAATNRTIRAFHAIMTSDMFRLNGPRIDLCSALQELVEAIEAEESDNDAWLYLGECGACCASDFIVGAYWALTEWHGGQWSPEYAAMCALGRIFDPGMSSLDKDNTSEVVAYRAVSGYFAARAGGAA